MKRIILLLVVVVAASCSNYQIEVRKNCSEERATTTKIMVKNVAERDILTLISKIDQDTSICEAIIFETSGRSGRKVSTKYYKELVIKETPPPEE